MTVERQPARANLPTLTQLDEPGTDVAELASHLADELTTLSHDPEAVVEIEEFAKDAQALAARRSVMLRHPIRALAGTADDGGPVATGLVELKTEVEALDPARFDFEPGWFSRALGKQPFVDTPASRYFAGTKARRPSSMRSSARSPEARISSAATIGRSQTIARSCGG